MLGNLRVLCVWCHALETRGVAPHALPGAAAGNQAKAS
jgi:hypothetical protein